MKPSRFDRWMTIMALDPAFASITAQGVPQLPPLAIDLLPTEPPPDLPYTIEPPPSRARPLQYTRRGKVRR